MSRIKPPRIPKGEDLKTTVANQARQIEQLLARVETLSTSYGQVMSDRNSLNAAYDLIKSERDVLTRQSRDALAECNYQRGYIARVKEEDGHRYGDLPK